MILLEKLTVAQLVKEFSTLTYSEGLLLCSQEPATEPYTQPDEFSLHPHILLPLDRS
jgi:hypothetical protein